jgi:hypothetical protein
MWWVKQFINPAPKNACRPWRAEKNKPTKMNLEKLKERNASSMKLYGYLKELGYE